MLAACKQRGSTDKVFMDAPAVAYVPYMTVENIEYKQSAFQRQNNQEVDRFSVLLPLFNDNCDATDVRKVYVRKLTDSL